MAAQLAAPPQIELPLQPPPRQSAVAVTVPEHHDLNQDSVPASIAAEMQSVPSCCSVLRSRPGTMVFLCVYDLGQSIFTKGINSLLPAYGFYHSGVEVCGSEWSF